MDEQLRKQLKELNQAIDCLLAETAEYEEWKKSSSATRNAIAGLKLPPLTKPIVPAGCVTASEILAAWEAEEASI